MDVTPAINAPQQAEAHVENVARHAARPPEPVQPRTPGQNDTVELSAEAVTIVMSGDAVPANIEVIDTGDGMSRALLNVRR